MPKERKQSGSAFGLSTMPIVEIKSELQKEIERIMLKIEYGDKK